VEPKLQQKLEKFKIDEGTGWLKGVVQCIVQKMLDAKCPSISQAWTRYWERIIVLFDCPDEIRKVIYTTNAIESLNSVIRKAVRNRKISPHDDSALKGVYLAIQQASRRCIQPIVHWEQALNRFAIEFEGRFSFQL